MNKHPTPTRPGWYWAKWRIAATGTRDGDGMTPSNDWEVVQVYTNTNGRPSEEPSVAVAGVEKTQWVQDFFWGPGPLEEPK